MSHETSQSMRLAILSLFVCMLVAVAGCASISAPWHQPERSSVVTPRMRIAAIEEIAARADDTDSAEQQQQVDQLATQIQTEPDPLVRQAIQEAMTHFSSPLARDVLIAGLQDDDLEVRLTCCRGLSQHDDISTISALRHALEHDEQLDVRLAAIDALGQIKSPQSVAALALAVSERDPALQFAGMQALKSVSGQDLGNDVTAWREYANSPQPVLSVAQKSKSWSPF